MGVAVPPQIVGSPIGSTRSDDPLDRRLDHLRSVNATAVAVETVRLPIINWFIGLGIVGLFCALFAGWVAPHNPFDLATLRMVAEHVTDPGAVVGALARLVKPGGRVVVFTVDLWSPITLVSRAVPFGLHYPVKKLLWGGEERDTFPTAYRMNTRRDLKRLFARGGFGEEAFAWLDDCSAFARFPVLNTIEMTARNALRKVALRYPECNLLGVYRRGGLRPGAI